MSKELIDFLTNAPDIEQDQSYDQSLADYLELGEPPTQSFLPSFDRSRLSNPMQAIAPSFEQQSKLGPNLNMPRNMLAGMAKAGHTLAQYLPGTPPELDELKAFGINENARTPMDKAAYGIGRYLPYAIASGNGALPQIMGGVTYGITQHEPGQKNLLEQIPYIGEYMPSGRVGSALEGGLFNAIPNTPSMLNQMRPSNFLRGSIEDAELAARQEAARGTPTNIGRIIDKPILANLQENELRAVPFSGVDASADAIGSELKDRAQAIFDYLLPNKKEGRNIVNIGERGENYAEEIQKGLANAKRQAQKLKNEQYDAIKERALKNGDMVEPTEFAKTANEYSGALKNTKILQFEKNESGILKALDKYLNPSKAEQAPGLLTDKNGNYLGVTEGKISQPLDLGEAIAIRSKVGQYANKLLKSPDAESQSAAHMFMDLNKSLSKDIEHALKNSKDKTLFKDLKLTDKEFGEGYAQFKDKNIFKHAQDLEDSDTILSHFIKTGQNERPKLLQKLLEKLPEKEKRLVAYGYLSRKGINPETGEIDIAGLRGAINNKHLGRRTRNLLFGTGELRKQLKNYSKLAEMNPDALHRMLNVRTGARGKSAIIFGTAGAGMGAGSAAAGIPGAIVGGISAPLAVMLGSRIANKALTSESLRNSLIDAMLANKQWTNPNAAYIQTLIQGKKGEKQDKEK